MQVFPQLLTNSFSHISLFISPLLPGGAGLTLAPGLLVCGFAWGIWVLMSWSLVKGMSWSTTSVGVDVFYLEELEIAAVQRKKHDTKHFSYFFLYSESHLPIPELCFGATDGLPFRVQQTTALTD